ncbi:hypothetical protein CPARK_000125600 [cyanobacterium endosymbiont of Braarudosphaera bigelowii]|uniref:Uncharacterized protein n=1 Tax=cyanobacterium endosymbiont of Braarudosphaera bigelowii TaxID=1285375 RepID=A0ABM7U5U4_9CHRO|nr:hypothetical protein CPARK_000125600 [cyanobacterium endosymbiont of Braarudosphaera bigelowii]
MKIKFEFFKVSFIFCKKLEEVRKENHRIKLKNCGKFLQTVIQ